MQRRPSTAPSVPLKKKGAEKKKTDSIPASWNGGVRPAKSPCNLGRHVDRMHASTHATHHIAHAPMQPDPANPPDPRSSRPPISRASLISGIREHFY